MGFFEAFLALCFLIFFHELGHFCMAKICGVKVEVFSIGFGTKILSKTIGQTQYALSLIPLGGYVKLKGQNDLNPLQKDESNDSFSSKKPWQKILILFAGPLFNFVLAFLLYLIIGIAGVKVLLPNIGAVMPDSPAFEAGIQAHDSIIEVENIPIQTFDELSRMIAESKGSIHLTIKRQEEILHLSITPKLTTTKNLFNEDIQRPIIGITASGDVKTIYPKGLELFEYATNETIQAAKLIFLSIEKLILGVIPLDQVGGVVGIVNVMADIAPNGIIALFVLVALISVNLGVLNLLPIPALDGGQILFCLYESIRRKPINEKALYALSAIGWSLLIALMILGLYNDIMRLSK